MFKSITSLLFFVGLALSFCDFSSNLCSSLGISCPSFSSSITVNGTTYSAGDFSVISFNEMTINHGDIQGRAAVKNNFYGLNGISVADLLSDNKEFGLVVGRNVDWTNNGAIVGNLFAGNAASVNVPSSLSAKVTLGCSSDGCLDSFFDSVQNYWSQLSSTLSLQNVNVDVTVNSAHVAVLNCQGSANTYVARFDPDTFNSVVGYEVSGTCSGSATWVINIVGSSSVYFGGNAIQVSGNVIYNIAPSQQVVIGSSVNGHIVAPLSNLNMQGGTITGSIICGNISNIIQVNIPSCPIQTSSSGSSASSSSGDSASSSGSSASSSSGDAASSASSSSGSEESSASASSSSGNSAGESSTTSTPVVASATTSVEATAIDNTGVVGSNNNENSASLFTYSAVLVVMTIALI